MKNPNLLPPAGPLSITKRSLITPLLTLGIVVLTLHAYAQTGSSFTEQEKSAYMKVHNDARGEVGSPAVVWDTKLANEAQKFADYLASTGSFRHANEFSAWKRDMGENLAWNHEKDAAKTAAEQWYEEKEIFQRLGTNGKNPTRYSGAAIGHYTQMVWQDTTKIGGGKAQYATGPNKGAWIVVGKYAPGGNYPGQYAYGTPNDKSLATHGGPSAGSNAQMKGAQGPDRSTYTQGDPQVTVKVANPGRQPVMVEWIDHQGKAVKQDQDWTLGGTIIAYPGFLYRFRSGGITTSYRVSKDAVQHYSIGASTKKAAPSGGAKATPPWAATQTKSTYKQGDPRVTISITNKTGQDIEFHWVDGNGNEQPPGKIKAGAEKLEMGTTYPGSLYRFKLNGKLLHTWVIQKDQTHLTIQQ